MAKVYLLPGSFIDRAGEHLFKRCFMTSSKKTRRGYSICWRQQCLETMRLSGAVLWTIGSAIALCNERYYPF